MVERAKYVEADEKYANLLPLQIISWRDFSRNNSGDFSNASVNFHLQPYLHILVVKCEDPENYRNELKPIILSFLDDIFQARKLHANVGSKWDLEWMIIYLPLGNRSGGFLSLSTRSYSKVFDEIYNDISEHSINTNLHIENHCFKLDMFDPSIDHRPQWSGFIESLKGLMVSTMETRALRVSNICRSLDSARADMSKFEFYRYFLYKEMAAFLSLQMQNKVLFRININLINNQEEALLHFDELEAVCTATIDFYLGNEILFVFPSQCQIPTIFQDFDDFHDKVHETVLSGSGRMPHMIEMAIYIFARQTKLLFSMGYHGDLVRRAFPFFDVYMINLLFFIDIQWIAEIMSNNCCQINDFVKNLWLIQSRVDLIVSTAKVLDIRNIKFGPSFYFDNKNRSISLKLQQYRVFQTELLIGAFKNLEKLCMLFNVIKF